VKGNAFYKISYENTYSQYVRLSLTVLYVVNLQYAYLSLINGFQIIFAQCKRKAEEEIHDIETHILACTGHSEVTFHKLLREACSKV
jgi:hypothetical protein